MTDLQLWSAVVNNIKLEYDSVPDNLKVLLTSLSYEICALKSRHQELVSSFDAERICADCMGECCKFGKYHFTAVDLIVFLSTGEVLFTPDFNNPYCPYHKGSGCLMEPGMRPFNCIIFICEQLENLLEDHIKTEITEIETRLRQIYTEFDNLLGNRFANGLLISGQRAIDSGQPLFNF